MYRKFIALLLVMVFVLSGCAAPAGSDVSTPRPDEPTTNEPGGQTPIEPGWLPAEGDENLTRTDVILDWADILTLESFPPQFRLNLRGALRSGCDHLRVDISEPDANNQIQVDIYAVRDPNLMCTEALVPFNVTVPLEPGQPGVYKLFYDGQPLGEFMVPGEGVNIAPVKPVDVDNVQRGNAFIESSSLSAESGKPVLLLSGYLPTPCHELKVDMRQVGSELQVQVYSIVDPDMICIQVTQPFETSVALPEPAAAKYSVTLNGEVIGEVQP